MGNVDTLIDKKDTFELVRDEVAAILAFERDSQKQLAIIAGKNPDDWDFNVFVERSNPWELAVDENGQVTGQSPLVNVFFDQASFNQSQSNNIEQQQATINIMIDCVSSKNSRKQGDGGILAGDELASRDLNRIMRLVRNIIMSNIYAYIFTSNINGVAIADRSNNLVLQRYFSSNSIFQPNINDQPSENLIVGRMNLTIDVNEFSPQTTPETLDLVSSRCLRSEDGSLYFQADVDYTI